MRQVKKLRIKVKFWIWGPRTVYYNMTCAQFCSSKITPPYSTGILVYPLFLSSIPFIPFFFTLSPLFYTLLSFLIHPLALFLSLSSTPSPYLLNHISLSSKQSLPFFFTLSSLLRHPLIISSISSHSSAPSLSFLDNLSSFLLNPLSIFQHPPPHSSRTAIPYFDTISPFLRHYLILFCMHPLHLFLHPLSLIRNPFIFSFAPSPSLFYTLFRSHDRPLSSTHSDPLLFSVPHSEPLFPFFLSHILSPCSPFFCPTF